MSNIILLQVIDELTTILYELEGTSHNEEAILLTIFESIKWNQISGDRHRRPTTRLFAQRKTVHMYIVDTKLIFVLAEL